MEPASFAADELFFTILSISARIIRAPKIKLKNSDMLEDKISTARRKDIFS